MAGSFDTYRAYLELTETDCFPTEQAEKLVALVNGAIVANVATKSDLDKLEKTLKLEIEAQDKRTFDQMKTLKSDLKLWSVTAAGIAVGLIKALDYLLPNGITL